MNRIILGLLALGVSLAPILVWAAEPNAGQARVIAEIEKVGGKVTVNAKSPGKPVTSVDFNGLPNPFNPIQVTDAALVTLEGLPQLQSLKLSFTLVTDAGLQHIEGLRQIELLDLVGTKVTDAGLAHLKGLTQLQWLDLRGTDVTGYWTGSPKRVNAGPLAQPERNQGSRRWARSPQKVYATPLA